MRVVLPLLAVVLIAAVPADEGWVELSGARDFAAWKGRTGDWVVAGEVSLDPEEPRRLTFTPGDGIMVNGKKGRAPDLVSRLELGDVEVHVEFLVPKKSNSGVKLMGRYEVQIFDSYGVKEPTGSDCGGIYPRAELTPTYHHIDKGFPPRVNASRKPGEWQVLDIRFRAPRFDDKGKKTANARFVEVVLNGEVIHKDVEVPYPTGHAWHDAEAAKGPLLLQGDHGPVAFRKVRVRPARD